MGRATIVPLVACSHGNVRLDSVEPAGAADKSDVPAAAMFQARSFGSVRGSSRSSEARPRSGTAGLPAHGLWPELTVATGSSRSSFVHTAPGYLCPCRHSQAVKPPWFGRTLTQYLVTSPCAADLRAWVDRSRRQATSLTRLLNKSFCSFMHAFQ